MRTPVLARALALILALALSLAFVSLSGGCTWGSDDAADPGDGSGSWIIGTWEGDVIDTPMRVEFTPEGAYTWTLAETGEQVANGTWSAQSDVSAVDLTQDTGQDLVFSVLPYAVYDGETLHVTAREDYLLIALVDPDAPTGNIESLMATLRSHPNVRSVEFVSAQDAAPRPEEGAEQTDTGATPADASPRIQIMLDDWSAQSDFVEWLSDEGDFKIVRAGSDAVLEPDGIEFSRVP